MSFASWGRPDGMFWATAMGIGRPVVVSRWLQSDRGAPNFRQIRQEVGRWVLLQSEWGNRQPCEVRFVNDHLNLCSGRLDEL